MTAANEVVFLLDVDDKLRILAAMKKLWGYQLTTVFPRQGHYALDLGYIAAYPPADIMIEHIGSLINVDFSFARHHSAPFMSYGDVKTESGVKSRMLRIYGTNPIGHPVPIL